MPEDPVQGPKARLGCAAAIKELRRALVITQFKLSALLRVTPNAVAQWESGRRCPDEANCLRLERLAKEWLGDGHRLAKFFFDMQLREAELDVHSTGEPQYWAVPPFIKDEDVKTYYGAARVGIQILAEAAAAHPRAKEELRHLADRINTRAAKWKKMEE